MLLRLGISGLRVITTHTLLPDPARCVPRAPRAPRALVFARDIRDCPPGRPHARVLTLHPLPSLPFRLPRATASEEMAHFALIGALLVLLSLFICVKPDSFSPGNFVVARPNAILSGCCMSSATSALLEEYTTAGTMVQQLTIPSCTLFGNSDCCVRGFSFMALSPNRNVACFTCQMYPLVVLVWWNGTYTTTTFMSAFTDISMNCVSDE
jgi:hypothetical protein